MPAFIVPAVRVHIEQLREFGGLLVIIGVAGELWSARRGSKVETDLREVTNSIISAADERIAETLERAAHAELLAAEANLARVRLEERLADRHVSYEQADIIASRLSSFANCVLDIRAIEENEAVRFCNELIPAFERAGINVRFAQTFPPGGIDPGLVLFARGSGDVFADAIDAAFIEAGITKSRMGRIPMVETAEVVMLRIGPR